jgi:hypothetical protein
MKASHLGCCHIGKQVCYTRERKWSIFAGVFCLVSLLIHVVVLHQSSERPGTSMTSCKPLHRNLALPNNNLLSKRCTTDNAHVASYILHSQYPTLMYEACMKNLYPQYCREGTLSQPPPNASFHTAYSPRNFQPLGFMITPHRHQPVLRTGIFPSSLR